MEKVTINGKEYQIDIEKCKEQGLLVEEKKYPKDWNDMWKFGKFGPPAYYHEARTYTTERFDSFKTVEETKAYIALGKLIQLRNWWWDNMCDGWRPDMNMDYNFIIRPDKKHPSGFILQCSSPEYNHVLSFSTIEIRDKFFQTYKDLIEEAKMFL